MTPTTAYLFATLSVLFWSGNAVIARLLHNDISPIALSSGRWWLATIVLLPFAWRYLRKDLKTIQHHWLLVCVLSLFGISLFNTLLYQAAHTTTSTNIALIQTTMPAMIVLLSVFLYREKTGLHSIIGVLLSISGAVLVVSRGELSVLTSWAFSTGDGLMMIANVVYALYSVLLKRLPEIHPMSVLGSTFVIGSLILLPLFIWDLSQRPLMLPDAHVGYGLLYVAIFPSILSYLFWNRSIETIGASKVGFFICLMPIFTAILAMTFLDETLHWFHLAGLLMVISGFVLFQKKPAKDKVF